MNVDNTPIASNAKRLLWAGFFAILAAGVGFGIRGGIFGDWVKAFNFTGLEIGLINGAGFTGFCFGIIIGGLVVDKVGYGKLVAAAFIFHVVSALVAFGAMPGMATKTAFVYLWLGTFIFAVANGTLEAVANPLVATLFPNNRTHYLNILHASWPAGMVIGGLLHNALATVNWKIQLGLFLLPAIFYGVLFFGQKFPRSEASEKGLSLGEMLRDVGIIGAAVVGFFIFLFFKDGLGPLLAGFTGNEAFFKGDKWMYICIAVGAVVWLAFSGAARWTIGAPLLFVLFITHALVGAVELGTDGWIQNIQGAILTPSQATWLFIFTSALMFALRFCADFIEKKIGLSPVGILLVCASLACLGLNLVSGIRAFGGALGALAVYAVGKTFFWPTMLAVASDRFPRCGAVAISIMGGLGMMSAGLVGSPGLGYAKDRFSGEELAKNPAAHVEFKAATPSKWLFFEEVHGIDGQKLAAAQGLEAAKRTPTQQTAVEAGIAGDRRTLKADSFIPATMALIYLLMLIYFKSIGGYKPVHIAGTSAAEKPLDAGMKPA
jgi:MFS transporter, DHA2 family, metal-tetracycline-proton antiporter